jgi:hypothetical protein
LNEYLDPKSPLDFLCMVTKTHESAPPGDSTLDGSDGFIPKQLGFCCGLIKAPAIPRPFYRTSPKASPIVT